MRQTLRTPAADKARDTGRAKFDTLAKVITASDVAWAIVGATASDAHAGVIGNGIDAASDAYGIYKGTATPDANPFFKEAKLDGRSSPRTREYLASRKKKTLAGNVTGTVGSAASVATHAVNVGSAARHTNSAATTMMHLMKLRQISASLPKDGQTEMKAWCDLIITMKSHKAGSRGVKIAAAVVPVPFASMAMSIATALATTGVKLTYGGACFACAAGLHWEAYNEMSPMKQKTMRMEEGPATRVIRELFARRGLTRVFGSYDTATLIREPGGWLAIGDKIAST